MNCKHQQDSPRLVSRSIFSTTKSCGFSLVEVTLALGIVSFAVLAMVGLNATTMQTLSDTRNAELARAISKSVQSALLDRDFEDLPGSAGEEFLFDASGFSVDSENSAIFKARATPQTTATIGQSALDPDAGRLLVVEIFHAPGDVETREDRLIASKPLVIARRGKL